jgi:glycosyltransferase involved in cell wall biosynthesis
MKVSVIMTCSDRLNLLRNTLASWSDLNYPDYDFTLIDDMSKDGKGVANLVDEFMPKINNLKLYRSSTLKNVNIIWNDFGKSADGDYIVFAMADEIISSKNIIQEMLSCPPEPRCTIRTLFLNADMTNALAGMDWVHNTGLIEKLPRFWDYAWDGNPNSFKYNVHNISHITGWSRERWDWFGWFRNHQKGFRWLDQDVVLRESTLSLEAVLAPNVSCYHQWHGKYGSNANVVTHMPSYIYSTVEQARLLEEAPHE